MSSGKRGLPEDTTELPERKRTRIEDKPSSHSSEFFTYPSTSTPARLGHPVHFQKPQSLLTFSYSPSRVLEFNDSALRYYVDPPRGANLRYGYDRWIRRPEEKGRLDGLLRSLIKIGIDRRQKGETSTAWLRDIGVVSWRGVMTKILTSPYEERDTWELNVILIDGTLFFEEHLSNSKIAEKNDIAPHHRLQMYYGYAFESYCTSTCSPKQGPRNSHEGWGGDVDTNVQWCSVAKTKLADTRIVIGGEVDCVRGTFQGDTDSFVELKTSLTMRGPQDEVRFEKKLLKFYFQSFLLGVPEIVVGFRTPSGQLTTLQSFDTLRIPRMVRDKPGSWDPQICLDWGKRFVDYLRANVTSTAPTDPRPQVWRAKFIPHTGVRLTLLEATNVDEVVNGEDRFGFLPSWFLDEYRMITLPNSSESSLPVPVSPSNLT